MKQLMKRYLVLWLLITSLLTLYFSRILGASLDAVIFILSIITFTAVMYLERVIPFRISWNDNKGDLKTDLISAGVLVSFVDPLLKVLLPLLVVAVYSWLDVALVELSYPFVVQLIVVTLLIELGKYWSHRLHHQSKKLWWLHAMHHSSDRIYVLNGLRIHPFNYCLNIFVAVLPAMLLGFTPESVLGYILITQPLVLLQHANIDLKSGWMNYLVSTNEVHRWHHSTIPKEANKNYGHAFLIWDHIFRTYQPPSGFHSEKRIGLFSNGSSYPANKNYWHQIASMFTRRCCVTG